MWTCPKCRAKIDDAFEVCWLCGTTSGGEEDPDFARADDIGPSPDRPWRSNHKRENDLDFEVAPPEIEVVDCYWAGSPSEAIFLAGQLMHEGIPATADTHNLQAVFAGFFGLVPAGPYFGPRVRVLAIDLPRAQSWLAGYEERRAKRECHHH
jgi:hypothetical protein